jgi:hypothetical protein
LYLGENDLTDLVALNKVTHRVLRVAAGRSIGAQSNVNMVSVVPREFPRLLAHYPILFAKNIDGGQLEPAALVGFQRGENLFITEGVWDAAYVPMQIQRLPFSLIPKQGSEQTALDVALDMSSPYVQTQDGERLFEDDGQSTKYLQNISSMMAALVSGSREAHAFMAKLSELNLLETVRIDVQFVDGSDAKLQGLYWIAAAVLKALPAAQLADLRDRGYLEWVYFQMASLAHISELVARKNRRLSAATPQTEAPRAAAPQTGSGG